MTFATLGGVIWATSVPGADPAGTSRISGR